MLNTAIIIVNWNSWRDTFTCLCGCSGLNNFYGPIFLIDNASTDNSVLDLRKALLDPSRSISLVDSTFPGVVLKHPADIFNIYFMSLSELNSAMSNHGLDSHGLYIISSVTNLGFGGGNNIGIQSALALPDIDLFWCLNSDALPYSNALIELEKFCLGRSVPVLSGSVLLEFDISQTVQTVGASFKKSLLKGAYNFHGFSVQSLQNLPACLNVDHPLGASMVLNREFISKYGMFDERFFLYYEEPDLALRMSAEFPFVCTKSLVYHVGGKSTGGTNNINNRSSTSDFHYIRSRTILGKKLGFKYILVAFFAACYSAVIRLLARRFDLFKSTFSAFLDGVRVN